MANVTITIPAAQAHSSPNVIVTINGVEYAVPVGQEVSIPAEVAAEIQRMLGHVPLPEPEEPGGGGGEAGGGVLIAHVTFEGTTATLDRTWAEIYEAMKNGIAIAQVNRMDLYDGEYDGNLANMLIDSVVVSDGFYGVNILSTEEAPQFGTDSPDGYPTYSEGD